MTDTFAVGVTHRAYHLALRRWRERMGYTQKQAGALVGVGGHMWSHIETLRVPASLAMTRKLAELTGLAEDEICPPWLRLVLPGMVTKVETVHEIDALSLDDPAAGLGVLAAPDTTALALARVGDEERRVAVDKLLTHLDARERDVLVCRFGLDGGPRKTLDEVAERLHVSRPRVQQIEQAALRKLRPSRISKRLRDYLSD